MVAGIGLIVFVFLSVVGIIWHADANGILTEKQPTGKLAEFLEQDTADKDALCLKAERLFYKAELKIARAEAIRKKLQVRRATDFLPFKVLSYVFKGALIQQEEIKAKAKLKEKYFNPDGRRYSKKAGRRTGDKMPQFQTALNLGIGFAGFAFLIMVISTPIKSVENPQVVKREIVKVYSELKTSAQIEEIQRGLSAGQFNKMDEQKINAQPTQVVELDEEGK